MVKYYDRRLTPEEVEQKAGKDKAARQEIIKKVESGTEGIPLVELEEGQCRVQKGMRGTTTLHCGKKTASKRNSTCDDCNKAIHEPQTAKNKLSRFASTW